jgi:LmbE family N-acetylglucosaminyl deacetylase
MSVITRADPAEVFPGVIAVVAPHMDDEVLGCGTTLARLPHKQRIHLVYATDGSRSSVPAAPWIGGTAPDLSAIRMEEALAAAQTLGIPNSNVHFLGYPDGRLNQQLPEFVEALASVLKTIRPIHLLVPFRFDRHPDHLAVNRAAMSLRQKGGYRAELLEYFVYSNWRLLPCQDIRRYIYRSHLIEITVGADCSTKRKALECFQSQTTKFYRWQKRPNLTQSLLDEVCRGPEFFLRYDPAYPDTLIFSRARTWIRLTHAVEPTLKKGKDRAVALLRSMQRGSNASQ